MESPLSVLSQYAALLPVDGRSIALPLVLLLAYRSGAHSSLATWAAVSNLPAAPSPETAEDAKRLKRQRIRRGVLIALALIALYTSEIGVILTSDSEEAANTFFKILVATFMTFAYFSTFAYAFSLPRAVWNHESGRLILRPYCATRSSKLRAAAILLLSIALATATVLLPSNAILHVVGTGALTFSMVSKPASRVTGVRKLTIFFCAYEAAVIALTVALVWMAPPNEKPTSLIGENSSKPNDEVSPEELAGMMPSGMMIFLSHIIPAFYAAPVGYYIAACLRYDWHASQQSAESASVLALEQLPARNGCACTRKSSSSSSNSGRPSTSSGLRIPSPSVLTASVPSVYFTTTLIVASILLCTISPLLNYSFKTYVFPAVDMTIQGMDQEKLALAKQYYETQTVGMFSMFLTIPVMCIAVAIQAASSGDRKALWAYKEIWHGKGAGKQPIALGNICDAEQGKDAANVWEKPTIVVEDVDANEETPLITLEEAIKS